MIVKLHKSPERKNILSMCDKEIIGKKISEKKLQLDLSSNFYKGEEKTDDEVREMVKEAYVLNIVGEKSVGFCLKEGWISKDKVIKIKNTPYAICLFVGD